MVAKKADGTATLAGATGSGAMLWLYDLRGSPSSFCATLAREAG